jgi:archaellum component FlaC
MAKKNTTIDDLAVIINKGFQTNQEHFDGRFDKVEGRLDKVEGRLDKVENRLMRVEIKMDAVEDDLSEIRKHQIAHTIYRDEFEKLENKVKALEKLLAKG